MTLLPLFIGESSLEMVGDLRVMHLKGTPYEIGYAHGKFLKNEIKRNLSEFIDVKRENLEECVASFQSHLVPLLAHTPDRFIEEMRGVAEGAEVPFTKIFLLNLFPEMFHCSGVIVFGSASKDGELYHARVLDYSIGKGLQESAILIITEPEGKIPFVNVTYAGFIGSVTGMNTQQIAIGEIGGKGYGSWEGMPMSFLIREILENADSLEYAKELLSETKRTCEYYYVISDAKENHAVGAYATANTLQWIEPGTIYTIHSMDHPEGQTFDQPYNCLALSGSDRYPFLQERLENHYGNIDEQLLQEIIRTPVSMSTNLHNAIFIPSKLQLLVAHAGPYGELACDQPYHSFTLPNLGSDSKAQFLLPIN